MTAYELGYLAHSKGVAKDKNPFDPETCPHSHTRWNNGWDDREQHNK